MSFYNELDYSLLEDIEPRLADVNTLSSFPCYDMASNCKSIMDGCLDFPAYDSLSDADTKLTSDTAISSQSSDFSCIYQRLEDPVQLYETNGHSHSNLEPEPYANRHGGSQLPSLNFESYIERSPPSTIESQCFLPAVLPSREKNLALAGMAEHLPEVYLNSKELFISCLKSPVGLVSELAHNDPFHDCVSDSPTNCSSHLVRIESTNSCALNRGGHASTCDQTNFGRVQSLLRHSPSAVFAGDQASASLSNCEVPDPSLVQTNDYLLADEIQNSTTAQGESHLLANAMDSVWCAGMDQTYLDDRHRRDWDREEEGHGGNEVKLQFSENLFESVFCQFEGNKEVCRPAMTSQLYTAQIGAIGTRCERSNDNVFCIFSWHEYDRDDCRAAAAHERFKRPFFLASFRKKFGFFTDMAWADHRNLVISHSTGHQTAIELVSFDPSDWSKPSCMKLPSVHTNEIREVAVSRGQLLSVGYDGMVSLMDISAAKSFMLRGLAPSCPVNVQKFDQVIGSVRWHPTDQNRAGITWDEGCWCLLDIRQRNAVQNIRFRETTCTSEFLDDYVVVVGDSVGNICFHDIRGTQQIFKIENDPYNGMVADLRYQPQSRMLASLGKPGVSLLSVGIDYELQSNPIPSSLQRDDYAIGTFASPYELCATTNRGHMYSCLVCPY